MKHSWLQSQRRPYKLHKTLILSPLPGVVVGERGDRRGKFLVRELDALFLYRCSETWENQEVAWGGGKQMAFGVSEAWI